MYPSSMSVLCAKKKNQGQSGEDYNLNKTSGRNTFGPLDLRTNVAVICLQWSKSINSRNRGGIGILFLRSCKLQDSLFFSVDILKYIEKNKKLKRKIPPLICPANTVRFIQMCAPKQNKEGLISDYSVG